MRDAKIIKREQPFTIKKSVPDGERIVQGIIDCCFIEDDSWVLLDFKTDSVYGKARIKEKAEYYRNQLELYKEALIINTGLFVKETYIYFLAEGTLYRL
ncbi:ATP-dependent helicase/nuclease subunit A [bioreactor metagenome]|uniref:ATP-dependent helicase/nuclease subunit A n=1 Tax=bioreactor metagenome TaxID=1076179 RepID=A0A645HXM8_9ZZZZ